MAAVEAMKKRTTAKRNFTRNVNKLNNLLDGIAQVEIVLPQFEKMNKSYDVLETAHDEFISAIDIDIEIHKDGLSFMEEIDVTHEATVLRYSKFLKDQTVTQHQNEREARVDEDTRAKDERKAIEEETRVAEELRLNQERQRKFDSEKSQISTNIATFKRMTINVKDSLNDVSLVDKRREWEKIESEFSSLKGRLVQFVGIDPTQNVDDINAAFQKDVEEVFVDAQKQVLTELKDVPLTGVHRHQLVLQVLRVRDLLILRCGKSQ